MPGARQNDSLKVKRHLLKIGKRRMMPAFRSVLASMQLHGLSWRFPTLISLASENRFFELRFDPHKKQFRHVIHVVFNPH